MNRTVTSLVALAALLLSGSLPSAASAQVSTGRIDVTVEDTTGGRLPAVNLDLSGAVTDTQLSDLLGQAHFLNLPVGTYMISAHRTGFAPYSTETLQVAAGASVALAIRLAVAGPAEIVDISAAVPMTDMKMASTTTHVTLEELQNIPSARDPWVVMQTVPAISVDRVNVGGAESSQQSNYLGKGAVGTDNTWAIDGVPVTDMGSTGSSAFYYDFDSFQEIAVTTGGGDAQNRTGGVQLDMVLKKGSATPRGNARIYFENQGLQATNVPAALASSVGGLTGKGNRTDQYTDYGFDLGGPIVKDKLWAWGASARIDIRNLTLKSQLDRTLFKNYAFKMDGRLGNHTRGNVTFYENNKIKNGYSVGPTRSPETAWNQSGPTKYYKGEGNFIVAQNLFAVARVAYVDGGFALTPAGGMDSDWYEDDAGVAHNSYLQYSSSRPQHYVGGDASYFAGTHELKFGFGYRKTPVESGTQYPGSHIVSVHVGHPEMLAYVFRDYALSTDARYASFYATDTISLKRFTFIGGIRFDRQTSSYAATSVPAVGGFDEVLPEIRAPAITNVYDYKDLTPRIGMAYAPGAARRTIIRASYAMFASQLNGDAAAFLSAIPDDSYVYYNAVDRDGDGIASRSEILFSEGIQGASGVNLGSLLPTVNAVGRVTAPRTRELLVGLDRELMRNVRVSAACTYRYMNNFVWNPPIGIRSSDYVQAGVLTGTHPEIGVVSQSYYALGAHTDPPGGGYVAENRPDYHQRYVGLEFSVTKRMSHHWMARVGFATTSWNEYFDNPATAIIDPTPTPSASLAYNSPLKQSGPLLNGGPVVVSSAGSGKSGLYLLPPRYQFSANGFYAGPWGFGLGASLVGRQGYGQPFYRSRVATGDPLVAGKNVLMAKNLEDFRLAPVALLDGRIEKKFTRERTTFTLDLDIFNVLNSSTILGRQYDARLTTCGQALEIMNPRIARLGVRFAF